MSLGSTHGVVFSPGKQEGGHMAAASFAASTSAPPINLKEPESKETNIQVVVRVRYVSEGL
jgi:hypothetical protein